MARGLVASAGLGGEGILGVLHKGRVAWVALMEQGPDHSWWEGVGAEEVQMGSADLFHEVQLGKPRER